MATFGPISDVGTASPRTTIVAMASSAAVAPSAKVTTESIGSRYWRWRLARWPRRRTNDPMPGYTVVITVPGDIPAFLEMALNACAGQDAANRIRTVVVPDQPSDEVRKLVESWRPRWTGPLDLLQIPLPERAFLPRLNNPYRFYAMQFVTGISAATSTHVLLHDADLLPRSRDLLERQYKTAVERDIDCLGVSEVWDSWYKEKGLRVTATWEQLSSVDWLRSFPPYVQVGHDGVLDGEDHTFDVTLHPQALTQAGRVDYTAVDDDFVHFNFVVSTYRLFQKHGPGFVDKMFRLLLIRILSGLFGSDSAGIIPTVEELGNSLGSKTSTVRYPDAEAGAKDYAEFRRKLAPLLGFTWLPEGAAERTRKALAPFDEFYSYANA